MLVSPAEPAPLRAIGRVSSLPEKLGMDFLIPRRGGFAGVQRKEVRDLRASVQDGRLGKEIQQAASMDVSPVLLVVEGRVEFTSEGVLIDRWGGEWTRARWYGVLWKVQMDGWWQVQTASMGETARAVETFETWVKKDKHGTFATRGTAPSIWGAHQTNRDWCAWVAQGLPGVGAGTAERLVDHFGGLPFTWKRQVTIDSLQEVDGIGPKKAAALYRVFNEGEGHE